MQTAKPHAHDAKSIMIIHKCSYIRSYIRTYSHARAAQRHTMVQCALRVVRSLLLCHVRTSLLSCPIAECSLSCIGGSSPFRRSSAGSLDEFCKEMGGRCMPLELDGRYSFVPLSLLEGSRLAVIRGEAIFVSFVNNYYHGNCRPTSKPSVIGTKMAV